MIIHEVSAGCSCYREDGGQFLMLRRIPMSLLLEVVAYFRQDLSKEAIVQIWFLDGNFRIVYPREERTSKTSVYYSFGIEEGEPVCMIHSHDTMKAFWSEVDDADEIGNPGLYGVFGSLDKSRITYKFRYVSPDGTIIPLDVWDIACNQ